jgi:hypothetical protein
MEVFIFHVRHPPLEQVSSEKLGPLGSNQKPPGSSYPVLLRGVDYIFTLAITR